MKVVINSAYGGFGLSAAGVLWMRERGSERAKKVVLVGEKYPNGEVRRPMMGFTGTSNLGQPGEDESSWRADPLLVECIESLGSEEASDRCAKLEVVEIPNDVKFFIDEYDGWESIHEEHRSWP